MLPYFAFVFEFLNPIGIVDRIRRHAIDSIVLRGDDAAKREAVRGIEQLADVALNAMEHKDKGVSMASVRALGVMLSDYESRREALPETWFDVDGVLATNPDFVSMSPSVLAAVSDRRIWFEMKVLRKYQTIFSEALNKMRDINYVIAIHTRDIAIEALEAGQTELFTLSIKFFNTYLRATINAKDVRTAYNILHQYRLIAERALAHDGGWRSAEIAEYFRYYATISFQTRLAFITETVAYDLCRLCELADEKSSPAARQILKILLEIDKESDGEVQERSLRGVRKAQAKLATYYLVHEKESMARIIFNDMETEPRERLASIRDEILAVHSSEYWEISDRGENFDYLPPERKAWLEVFFSWFSDLPAPQPVREPTLPPTT